MSNEIPTVRIPQPIIDAVNKIYESSKKLKEDFDDFNKSIDQWELNFSPDTPEKCTSCNAAKPDGLDGLCEECFKKEVF
jgi:hypothetical protein